MAELSSIIFRGLIAPEEPVITGDFRQFARASLTSRRLPKPAMFVRSLAPGHDGAVTVARLESFNYEPGRGWTGAGTFLDPRVVPEVVEAVYLTTLGVASPSVDLQPDATWQVIPHPHDPERRVARVLQGRVMGFTLVPYAAFEEVEVFVTSPSDVSVLASAGARLGFDMSRFTVNASFWRSMPIADRDTPFNFEEAVGRLLEWSRGRSAQFRRAFLYQDAQGEVTSADTYHLPIADVIDGRLTLVPRAVFSAAVFMSGGHGGLPNISEQEQERVRNVITDIYDVLREHFGDPRVRPPWQRGGRQDARGAQD